MALTAGASIPRRQLVRAGRDGGGELDTPARISRGLKLRRCRQCDHRQCVGCDHRSTESSGAITTGEKKRPTHPDIESLSESVVSPLGGGSRRCRFVGSESHYPRCAVYAHSGYLGANPLISGRQPGPHAIGRPQAGPPPNSCQSVDPTDHTAHRDSRMSRPRRCPVKVP